MLNIVNPTRWLLVALMLAPNAAMAANSLSSCVERDRSYEQALRYAGQADNVMTPARFLRWMRSLSGQTDFSKPTHDATIEFRPVVQAHDDGKRVIAEIAYRF